MALEARKTYKRAARLLIQIPEGEYVLKIKFLREWEETDWVVEDQFDPVRAERKKGQGIVEITQNTNPGSITGIDRPYYQNVYPVSAVVYGLYPLRGPDPANLAPFRVGDIICVAQRVVEHFEGELSGQASHRPGVRKSSHSRRYCLA